MYCNYITEILIYIVLPTTIKKIKNIKTYKHNQAKTTIYYLFGNNMSYIQNMLP